MSKLKNNQPGAEVSPHINEPATLLVADDDTVIRKLLAGLLSHSGYRALEAGDGAQALAIVKQEPVAGILLDVMMPGLDGFEVCRRLKSDPATAHIPVVLVTALTDEKHHQQGFEAGASAYVRKPINVADLLAVVQRVIGDARPRPADERSTPV